MNKTLLLLLFSLQHCLAQQPDLNVWLTLAGTKQQVLDTLEKRAPAWEMTREHWYEHSMLYLRFENSRKDSVVLGFFHDTLAWVRLCYICHSPYGDTRSLNHFLATDTSFYIGPEEITENKIEIEAYQLNDFEIYCDERDKEQFRNYRGGYQRLIFVQYKENIFTWRVIITKMDLLLHSYYH